MSAESNETFFLVQSDVNTVCFADDSGHIIYSGGDDNLCKVVFSTCLYMEILHYLDPIQL